MNMPRPFKWVKAHAISAVIVAYAILIPIDTLLTPLSDWLPMCLLGAVMGPASYGVVRFVLSLQRVNETTLKADTFRRFVSATFWFGAVSAGMVLVVVIGWVSEAAPIGFGLAMSAGWCLAAVDSWKVAECFPERGEAS